MPTKRPQPLRGTERQPGINGGRGSGKREAQGDGKPESFERRDRQAKECRGGGNGTYRTAAPIVLRSKSFCAMIPPMIITVGGKRGGRGEGGGGIKGKDRTRVGERADERGRGFKGLYGSRSTS